MNERAAFTNLPPGCDPLEFDVDIVPDDFTFCAVPDIMRATFAPFTWHMPIPPPVASPYCPCHPELSANAPITVGGGGGGGGDDDTVCEGGIGIWIGNTTMAPDCCDQDLTMIIDAGIPCMPCDIEVTGTVDIPCEGSFVFDVIQSEECGLVFTYALDVPCMPCSVSAQEIGGDDCITADIELTIDDDCNLLLTYSFGFNEECLPSSLSGFSGFSGFSGYSGPIGPAGADGADGADGATGDRGSKGSKGSKGEPGTQGCGYKYMSLEPYPGWDDWYRLIATNTCNGKVEELGTFGVPSGLSGHPGVRGSKGDPGCGYVEMVLERDGDDCYTLSVFDTCQNEQVAVGGFCVPEGPTGPTGPAGLKTAIVEAGGAYHALWCVEAPETLFMDPIRYTVVIPESGVLLWAPDPDPMFVEVCEPDTVLPLNFVLAADTDVVAQFQRGWKTLRLTGAPGPVDITLTWYGTRRGASGNRFREFAPETAIRNAAWWNKPFAPEGIE